MIEAHTDLHMSPAQAAEVAGVSRWTIMRAIKSHDLKAIRDNKNQWKISKVALDQWRPHTVRTHDDAHSDKLGDTEGNLQKELSQQTARADVAEALLARERELNSDLKSDRDYWRKQAEDLMKIQARRPKWWPW